MDAITYAMCKNYTNKKVSESTGLHREIVTSLPSTGDNNTIYMVLDPNASSPDVYDEWLWVNGTYEHIGSTRVDLTDYYNKTQIDTALSGKANVATTLAGYGITDAYTKTETDTALSGKANTSDIPTTLASLSDDSTHRVVTDTEKSTWNGKSNFSGSYNDLSNKPTIPTTLSQLSTDATHRVVTDTEKSTWSGKADISDIPTKLSDFTNDSGYVTTSDLNTALSTKQDSLTFDNVPTQNSNNPVKSGGVFTAVDDVYSVMGQNGAKNLINYPYYDPSGRTNRGITFTYDKDGIITANGSTNANDQAYMTLDDFSRGLVLPSNKKYTLTCEKTNDNNKGFAVLYFKNADNTAKTVSVHAVYEDGTTRNANSDYVSLLYNNVFHTSVTFWVDTDTIYITQARIHTNSGTITNAVLKPMLRLAEDTDNTYQPYAMTNRQLTEGKAGLESVRDYVNELGVKNLIPYPYYEKTHTENGVTFTDNGDGTITANGTATDTAIFSVVLGNTALSANGNLTINTNKPLILSGCPSGGGNNTYRIQYGLTDGTSYWAKTASDTGSGVKITPVDGLNSYCFDVIRVMVFEGCTVNNLTFKPMLRLAADINDDTYVPYAMTNKQLTEKKANSATTLAGYGITDAYTKSEVDATISALGGNEIIDDIDISSYDSSSNMYTCPSDGYIQMQIGSGEKGEACVDGYPLLWVRENEGTLAVFPSLYVKKGTKVNLVRSATSSGVAFTFYKLGYDS